MSNDGVISYRNRRLALKLRRDMPVRARVLVRTTEVSIGVTVVTFLLVFDTRRHKKL